MASFCHRGRVSRAPTWRRDEARPRRAGRVDSRPTSPRGVPASATLYPDPLVCSCSARSGASRGPRFSSRGNDSAVQRRATAQSTAAPGPLPRNSRPIDRAGLTPLLRSTERVAWRATADLIPRRSGLQREPVLAPRSSEKALLLRRAPSCSESEPSACSIRSPRFGPSHARRSLIPSTRDRREQRDRSRTFVLRCPAAQVQVALRLGPRHGGRDGFIRRRREPDARSQCVPEPACETSGGSCRDSLHLFRSGGSEPHYRWDGFGFQSIETSVSRD